VACGAAINNSRCEAVVGLRETIVTVVSCTSSYTSIISINRCPWVSMALASSGSSHEVVLGGSLLVSKFGIFAVLACVVVCHTKTMRLTIVCIGFASDGLIRVVVAVVIIIVVVIVPVGAVLVLTEHEGLEGRDVFHGRFELCCQICVGGC
jgi:hypothetical protein